MHATAIASRVALALGLVALATAAAAEDDWYPSRYGAEDTLGAINLLSPADALRAARLVDRGKVYSLAVDTGPETPAYGTRSYQIVTGVTGDGSGTTLGSNRASGNDDLLITWLGIGTQLDGLGHLGIDNRYYNGVHAADFVRQDGLAKFGTHELPPIVTRGVLLDVAGLLDTPRLPAGRAISREEVERAAQRANVEIQKGDVVLLHTGWGDLAAEDPKAFLAGEPGLGKAGAEYLAERGVVAVGADVWGLEAVPAEDPNEAFPVHQILLAKHGVYVLENIVTAELAADGVSEFLFVLGQPRFVGAVQMVVHPVAIR